jgi:hypothetical protein
MAIVRRVLEITRDDAALLEKWDTRRDAGDGFLPHWTNHIAQLSFSR